LADALTDSNKGDGSYVSKNYLASGYILPTW
jgi:hypothetical protein